LGKPIIVLKYRIRESKFDDARHPHCLTVQFEHATETGDSAGGDRFVFFTGSTILKDQLEKYADKLPFSTTVRKVGKYYTFS